MASTIIVHIDMDAFFASVEQLDDPSLKDQCVVVGGASQRGVVAAASYNARRHGIHSAMPIFQARQKCPDLVIVPPRRKRYVQISRKIMRLLEDFSPLVEPVSIDEAFVDMTGSERLYGDIREMAMAMKTKIYENVQLTCSVGVAPAKYLAKIASDMDKPDGLTLVSPKRVSEFIDDLTIGKVPGVGTRCRAVLAGLGIVTLGQVKACDDDLLVRKLGKFGYRLIDLANGQDASPVTPVRVAKSMSTETTLSENTVDRDTLAGHLLAQSQTVARQLLHANMRARTVTLKIKTDDFQQHSRNRTLRTPFHASETIYQAALNLLDLYRLTRPVRLVGVSVSGLQPADQPVQTELFPENDKIRSTKWEQVDRAMDAVASRFGKQTVKRGSLSEGKKNEK